MSEHETPSLASAMGRQGAIDASAPQVDVAEGPRFLAELYGFPIEPRGRRFRRGLVRGALWVCAGAISLLANAEFFLLLGPRVAGEIASNPVDPAVLLIDLPAIDRDPTLAAVPSTATTSLAPSHTEEADDNSHHIAAEAATAAPVAVLAPPQSSKIDDWRAAPLPVPRPSGGRRAGAAQLQSHKPANDAKRRRSSPASVRGQPSRIAAPSAFTSRSPSNSDWKSQVVAALNRVKRFPDGTEATGSPTLRMTVASSGFVAGVALVASSGSSTLDAAAVATVRRASPLPPPPGGTTALTFRMNFKLRSP